MTEIKKMLIILVDETARHAETTLYETIVRRLLARGIAGATVNRGIMGYRVHHQLHRRRLLGVSDDRPVSISAVDSDRAIPCRAFICLRNSSCRASTTMPRRLPLYC